MGICRRVLPQCIEAVPRGSQPSSTGPAKRPPYVCRYSSLAAWIRDPVEEDTVPSDGESARRKLEHLREATDVVGLREDAIRIGEQSLMGDGLLVRVADVLDKTAADVGLSGIGVPP